MEEQLMLPGDERQQGCDNPSEEAAPLELPAHPAPFGGVELTRDDELWPQMVNDMRRVPSRLFVLGDALTLAEPCVAIVGTRRPTPYGEAVASMAGRICAEMGLTVVSGGAMGSDAIAARAALDAGGRTVVVPGCGPDVVYPKSSQDVYRRAVEQGGCIVSLEGWGMPPTRFTFPKRNVLIAALARVVVVGEAGLPSGTMSTAEAAMAMNRTLMSAPGSIFSVNSKGSNSLIVDGATPIIDEMGFEQALSIEYGVLRRLGMRRVPDRGRLLSALIANPLRIDELSTRLDLQLPILMGIITKYEMQGLVCRLPDGRYSPTTKALLVREESLDA